MKFITATVLTALLGFAAPLYFAWWSFAVTSAVIAFVIKQKTWAAFVTGFAGMFFLWAGLSLVTDAQNEHLLSQKIADILQLGGSSILLIFIGAFCSALISGLAAITGSLAGKIKQQRAVE